MVRWFGLVALAFMSACCTTLSAQPHRATVAAFDLSADLKGVTGAPHGICTTHKDWVNEE